MNLHEQYKLVDANLSGQLDSELTLIAGHMAGVVCVLLFHTREWRSQVVASTLLKRERRRDEKEMSRPARQLPS